MIADLSEPFGPTSAVKPATSISSTRNRYQSTRMTRRSSIMACPDCFCLRRIRVLRDVFFQRSERVLADDDGERGSQKQRKIAVIAFVHNAEQAALPQGGQGFVTYPHRR